MQFDRGFISPYFITDNEKRTVELDNPVIMIMDKQWSSIQKKFTIPSHFCGFWHCFTDILSSSCPHIPLPPVDPVASSTATRGFRGFFSHRIRCCWRFCPKVPWPVRSTAGVFGWAISLYNFNGKWLWFIMGILCGYHGAHYFQTKPRIMLLTTFLAGSWVNASNLVAPKTGFLIPSGKHTLWLCQNSYWKWP